MRKKISRWLRYHSKTVRMLKFILILVIMLQIYKLYQQNYKRIHVGQVVVQNKVYYYIIVNISQDPTEKI
jgi:hypothetical protein